MSDDDLPELTPEQIAAFHRAAATLKEEDYPEEMADTRKGYLRLAKDRAYSGPGVHYESPPIHGVSRGSYRLGPDILKKLGHGDLKAGAAVAAGMFSVEPGDDASVVQAEVVRDIGHGDLAKGRKVLERFVQMVRRQGAQSRDDFDQPDGVRPSKVIRR